MNPEILNHLLSEEEKELFEQNGFLIVPNAIPTEVVDNLNQVVDRLEAERRVEQNLEPHTKIQYMDFIGRDAAFLELLDCPKTFGKVWGILGWHIQLYHSHMLMTPPVPIEERPQLKRLGWHQDTGQLNNDLETTPRPRVSLKVGFFLTDTTDTNRGNFHVIPGSHLKNSIELPDDGVSEPEGAIPVRVPPGTAVFFDRRLWHAGGHNTSDITRKVLFYGYSYRWLKPRDDMTVAHYMERSDPIRRQLLGAGANYSFTSPREEDVPLKTWLRDNLGEESLVL
ncbi:MAG: hypothetical protein CMO31_08275 [Trueperaceae bacterium]|jgi:ectoine hydroxylase|nr:hypothetical protein [Trueperaceae bacterium]MCH2667276.1 phytanoyl-CoA dioxygenase family protein [Deinococcales bacterium]|tara:strand:- start:25931 stop:26776 length:846 start_codon:yes stop_codon:yes gene_type:complete